MRNAESGVQRPQSVDCKVQVSIPIELFRRAKEFGFSDKQLGKLLGMDEDEIHRYRQENKIVPTFKLVDTCGAEFEAFTPYYYSTYEIKNETRI